MRRSDWTVPRSGPGRRKRETPGDTNRMDEVLHYRVQVLAGEPSMAKKPKSKRSAPDMESLLTDLLITQLAASGVQGQTIRGILGCDINRVSRITKHINAARKSAEMRERGR